MRKNEHVALVVLGAMAAGLAVSVPYADTLAGGLCASASLAGLIGGLADWFAVSAIFTKPLGISFKTDLIVGSRDRLAHGVGKMVSEELLAPQSVESFLARYDLGAMAVKLFDRLHGERYLRDYLVRTLRRVLAEVDTKALGHIIRAAVHAGARSADWRAELAGGVRWLEEEGYLDDAGRVLLSEARRIAETRGMHDVLVRIAADALCAYERDSVGRQFVHGLMDISPERCAVMVEEKVSAWLAEKERSGRGEVWLSRGLIRAIEHLDVDAAMAALSDRIAQQAEAWIAETHAALAAPPETIPWLTSLMRVIEREVDALLLDDEKNRAFNQWTRSAVCAWLTSHQAELASLAAGGVDRLSDRELTGYLKAKVGHDLQMIRVNGSLVGALVGAGLYFLRWAWKAVAL